VYQKLLLRDGLRVKQLSILVSIAEVITRAVHFSGAMRSLAVRRRPTRTAFVGSELAFVAFSMGCKRTRMRYPRRKNP